MRTGLLCFLFDYPRNIVWHIVHAVNIDQLSLNKYSMIPGLFGGAGTGCVAEVLLFNPEERYENVHIRREYINMCSERLAQDGVSLIELKTHKDSGGNYYLRETAEI